MVPTIQKLDDVSVVTRWVADARRSGETDVYPGKRRWPRTKWNVSLVVKLVGGRNAGEVVYVRGRDVSLGGVGFMSRRKLPLHTEIEVCAEHHSQTVRARIVHSTQTVGGYLVGAEFVVSDEQNRRRSAG